MTLSNLNYRSPGTLDQIRYDRWSVVRDPPPPPVASFYVIFINWKSQGYGHLLALECFCNRTDTGTFNQEKIKEPGLEKK